MKMLVDRRLMDNRRLNYSFVAHRKKDGNR
jgi:hypothetical protein